MDVEVDAVCGHRNERSGPFDCAETLDLTDEEDDSIERR